MMNEQIFIILAEETERGGLFDIGATLPLVGIQFIMLMFVLNTVLYKPVISLVNERNEHVLDNLNKASEMILISSKLISQYESELTLTKKEAKKEISELQKMQKETFENELKVSQKAIDNIVQNILDSFTNKKQTVLTNIDSEVNSLSKIMLNKLFK
jgi:F-type H+-transporting ATPase subunit b